MASANPQCLVNFLSTAASPPSEFVRSNTLGNIGILYLINQVALLDYGQVKDLPEVLRLGFASLMLAIADNDPVKASESYRYCIILPYNTCIFN